MDVKLVIQKGSTRTKVLHLRRDETTVGRRQDCDLRIESAQVSRRHCLLSMEGRHLTVEDLNSVNGTFLNGRLIKGKVIVRPGDVLQIGPLRFVVEYRLPSAPTANSGPHDATEEDEVLDVLPLADDDDDVATAQVLPDDSSEAEVNPSASMLEALEVAEELGNDAGWHLPESDELRGLLSDMDIDIDESKH